MAEENIFGRKKEKGILKRCLQESKPSFIAIYGRRRVGKTFLVDEFFGNHQQVGLYLKYTGAKLPTSRQLKLFYMETRKYFRKYDGVTELISKSNHPRNWDEAFFLLRDVIDQFRNTENTSGKIIVFLDELPWFDVHKSGFKAALDYHWNQYFVSQKDMILVVAGSAAHWMIKNLVKGKGGLYRRITEKIPLLPFDLKETKLFIENYRKIALSNRSLAELYMVTGGVVKYLAHYHVNDSPWVYIAREFASRSGNFYDEFEDLYLELFEQAEQHQEIIEILFKDSQRRDDTGCSIKGMTRDQISKQTSISSGGTLTKVLRELSQSGFVSAMSGIGGVKQILFRLTDLYSLFYLYWFKYQSSPPATADEWLRIMDGQKFKIWSGYAFENVIFNNISLVKIRLGISALNTRAYSLTQRGKRKNEIGAEIDLVIERPDKFSNLIEMKYYIDLFKITNAYKKIIDQKIKTLKKRVKTTPIVTFITLEGLHENEYSRELNAHSLTIEDLIS